MYVCVYAHRSWVQYVYKHTEHSSNWMHMVHINKCISICLSLVQVLAISSSSHREMLTHTHISFVVVKVFLWLDLGDVLSYEQ